MFTWFKKNLKYFIPLVLAVVLILYPETTNAGLFDFLNPKKWLETALFVLLQICGLIFMLAGLFLEIVIKYTIVEMKGFVDSITAIDLAWRTIRDVANIIFVFVLLLISINIILGSWGSGQYNKSLIPKVIIAALLINFSLMFTKVVIDVSNIVTFEFYDIAKSIREPSVSFEIMGQQLSTGLTSSIADRLGVLSLMGQSAPKDPKNHFPIFSLLFGIITVLIATFVFFVIGALLLVRFVMFVFLMLTSPIAFIGELLPQLKSQSEKWWKSLSAQATFAPIFFVLVLIVVLIINDPGFIAFGKSAGVENPFRPGATDQDTFKAFIALIFQYTIVIGLLVAALVAAKQTSNKAGEGFVKWGSKWAGKAVMGSTAALGRNTLGRLGNRVANSGITGYLASGESGFGKAGAALGKGLILGGDKLRNYTYDSRAFGGVSDTLGAGGVGVKGGLVGARKARKEKLEERGKTYATAMAVSAQYGTIQEAENKLGEARANLAAGMNIGGTPQQIADRKQELEQKVKDAEKALEAARKTTPSVVAELRGEKTPEREALAEATRKLTNAQRKEADTAMKVIDAREEYIEGLKTQLKLTTNPAKQAELAASISEAQNGLNRYRDGLSSDLKSYIKVQGDLSKVVKQASGQISGSQRAYGETLAGGSYLSTRQAGDALRERKKSDADSLAGEILKVMKANQTEQPATPPAAPATPPGTPTPPGP